MLVLQMLRTIHFDNQVNFVGVKVDDIWAKRLLSVKLDPEELFTTKSRPQALFAFGLVATQASGMIF